MMHQLFHMKKAIEMFKAYIEEDGNNLYEYNNSNHAHGISKSGTRWWDRL